MSRSAQQANRIVVLCRNLVEEIEAYELASAWEADGDEQDEEPDDEPFLSPAPADLHQHSTSQRGR